MGDRGRSDGGRRTQTKDGAKKRIRSKSTKRVAKLSPLQERLKETDCYLLQDKDRIVNAPSIKERLILVDSLLSDDVTDISRIWPNQLKNKDSRIRRELSEKGSEFFKNGELDKVLEYYNKALMYSSGKGTAHTLARRAAFFLSTGELNLALRDLSTALENGCLQTELLDFLLSHHTPNTPGTCKMRQKYKWAENIREYLDAAAKVRSGKQKEEILSNIVESIEAAAKEKNIDKNLEIRELELPVIKESNPLIPAFSECVAISSDPEKGRTIKARRDIKAGELLCVDSPVCSILCPETSEATFNHCLQCFRFTRAPLPCDTCCSVVFCSKECKNIAMQSYHRYECPMKIYELFQHEGREVFGLFMALRAITQKPLQYFTENRAELEKFLDRLDPVHPFPGRAYLSSDYRTLVNLATHNDELDDDVLIRNSVLAVFFHRFLKFSGYFGNSAKSNKKTGMKDMEPNEAFMLRMIHQLINLQAFNSHSVHEMSDSFDWKKIGTSINPSLALVNHSCDSNAIRCNLNKNSILVAGRHIPQGEEITDSYTVHFRSSTLNQRQYHTLKNYSFACECPACVENWPLEDDIPDELPRVPNFEQEVIYRQRQGDKKEIVKQIVDARRIVEGLMTEKRFDEALIGYQVLCEKLEQHIRKPHIYFLQARSGISHCLWNLYCTQKVFDDDNEETEDVTGRDHANTIYKKDFIEKPSENDALDLGEITKDETDSNEAKKADEERKKLLELAKQSLDKSSSALQSLHMEHIEMKENIKAVKDIVQEHSDMQKVSGNITISEEDIKQLLKEKQQEAEAIKRELENFNAEVKVLEEGIKERRQKEQKEQEEIRKKEMEEKKLKRAKEFEEKMKKYNEESLKRKEEKAREEEKKRIQREEMYKKIHQKENEKFEKAQMQRKLQMSAEMDELEELLKMAAEDDEICNTADQRCETADTEHILEQDNLTGEMKTELCNSSDRKTDLKKLDKGDETTPGSLETLDTQKGNSMEMPNSENTENPSPLLDDNQLIETKEKDDQTSSVQTTNTSVESKENVGIQKTVTERSGNNVWTAIREAKKMSVPTSLKLDVSSTGEKLDIDDLDSFILELRKKAKSTRMTSPNNKKGEDIHEKAVIVTIEEEDLKDEQNVDAQEEKLEPEKLNPKPFDYDKWNNEIKLLFKAQEEEEKKAYAKDQMYIDDLKKKINDKIKLELDKKKTQESKAPMKNIFANQEQLTPKVKAIQKNNDFESLRARDKEKKRKRREEKYKQSEEKVRDMALKSIKIDKIASEAEEELKKMREISQKLISKSKLNEKDFASVFDEIRTNELKDIEKEDLQSVNNANDIGTHWTEEERNKWPSKGDSQGFSSALSLIKVAAQGKANISDSLKEKLASVKESSLSHTIDISGNSPVPSKTLDTKNPAETVRENQLKGQEAMMKACSTSNTGVLDTKPNRQKSVEEVSKNGDGAIAEKKPGVHEKVQSAKVLSVNSSKIEKKEERALKSFAPERHLKENKEDITMKSNSKKVMENNEKPSVSYRSEIGKPKVTILKFSKGTNENSNVNVEENSKEKVDMKCSANNDRSKQSSSDKHTKIKKDDEKLNVNSSMNTKSSDIPCLNKTKKNLEKSSTIQDKKNNRDTKDNLSQSQVSNVPVTGKETTQDKKTNRDTNDKLSQKQVSNLPVTGKETIQDKKTNRDIKNKLSQNQVSNMLVTGKESDKTCSEQHNMKHDTEHKTSINSGYNNPNVSNLNVEDASREEIVLINEKSDKTEVLSSHIEIKSKEGFKNLGESDEMPNSMNNIEISTFKKQRDENETCEEDKSKPQLSGEPKRNKIETLNSHFDEQMLTNKSSQIDTDTNFEKEKVKKNGNKHDKVSTERKSSVHEVNPNSFIPKGNEINAIKLGSPSALRKIHSTSQPESNNYKISKIPTEIIVLPPKKKKADSGTGKCKPSSENYAITKVPTEKIVIENKQSVVQENQETKSVTLKIPSKIPPPPKSKPPPPPAFKPPPPPPLF